jgi:fructose-1,6-bisphosphatase
LKGLIDFLDEKLESIYANVDEYATTTQINILSNAMNILDKAIYNYRLSCGRSTDNKELNHQGELNLSGNINNETTLKYTAEEMKQIQATTSEPDEEVQEFLDQI